MIKPKYKKKSARVNEYLSSDSNYNIIYKIYSFIHINLFNIIKIEILFLSFQNIIFINRELEARNLAKWVELRD